MMSGARLSTAIEPERLVKTHCCFCGQQCGIQLKVRDNEVIGFEPWEDFPFNRGMLCPKGVKRYLQGSHPDRLLTALRRDTSAPAGFSPMPYDDAIRRVASEIDRLQKAHGPACIGVLGGASLTTEKTYLLGKFARVCLRTPYIDYNGRLCMVSAGAANKKAFGVDRAANPWSDIPRAEVVWISGSNVAECAPITTEYVWQARENGARVIVVDPRITPIARTADLFLPVRPGRDDILPLFAGLHRLAVGIEHLQRAEFPHDPGNRRCVTHRDDVEAGGVPVLLGGGLRHVDAAVGARRVPHADADRVEGLAAVEELAVGHRHVVDGRDVVDVAPVDLLQAGAGLVPVTPRADRDGTVDELLAVLDPAELEREVHAGDTPLVGGAFA